MVDIGMSQTFDPIQYVIDQLILLRKERGLSQNDLNTEIGVADRLVSKWECGERRPRFQNLLTWAAALGIDALTIPTTQDQVDETKPKVRCHTH